MNAKLLLHIHVLLFFNFLIFTTPTFAQNRTVTGTVTSRVNGQPLPGATVSVKGTRVATTTGTDGSFKLNVPEAGKVLTISYVGMASQDINIPASGTLDVSMEQTATSKMDEVVVVGYGTQRKSVVTGAISSVRASDLENQPVVRVEQALQGRTSGLTISSVSGQPGAASTVRLRGFTSFGNDKNNPLWVVDGVVIDNGGIGYLNEDDIESIEVLKDGASAAIYGTRAAAGVILITTKKGKSGSPRINYSGFYGTQAPGKKVTVAGPMQYATLRNQSLRAAGKPAAFADSSVFGAGTDWQKQIFNYSAPKMNHELSISGGTDKSTFFTSFGYNDIKGVIATPISKWRRMNFRINTQFKPASWLSFGENVGYSYGKNSGVGEVNREFGGIVNSALNLDPITPTIITDTASQKSFYPWNNATNLAAATRDPSGRLYGISPYVGQEIKNPLAIIHNRLGNYAWDHNIVGNAFVDITPVKGLVIHSSLGTKMAFYGSESFSPSVFYNNSTSIGQTNINRQENWVINWNVENTISYNKIFDRHNVTLLAGWGEYKDGNTRGATVQYNNIYANYFDQASFRFTTLPQDRQNSSGSDGTDHRINSLFSRVQYNYDEKYLLTALIRRDGSSRFGSDNRFGYFPSVSVGWVPTRESFFPTSNVLNNLKIRASYGVTGNDGIGDFAYVTTVDPGGQRNYSFGTTDAVYLGFSPSGPARADLKWEETRQTDIGLDAVLLNSLTFTVDVYKKKTVGILQNPTIPAYAGYGSFAQNFDDIENTGLEMELGYKKKIGELNFGVNGNISFYKNKVTKMIPGQKFIEDNSATFQNLGNITRTGLGLPYQQFYGYKALGVFQTQDEIDHYTGPNGNKLQPNAKPGDMKWANLNGDNSIGVDDRTYLGNPNPTVSYGLTINLGYKNFDFVIFGSGSGGNKIFQGLRRLDIATANYTKKYFNAWTATNTNTNVARLVDGDPNANYSKMSSFYLESGTFFRLRTIQLGYTFPKALTNRWGMKNLRAYVLSENLFTITKYSGYNPEVGVSPDSGGGAQFGIDRGTYVQPRAFLVGVNVGF
jgi:TonB-linked SusC/RagA family outer membrane protein